MGKKLDALLMRRTFKTDKFKATVALAISRIAVIKNQRQARCSIATSDVVELLNHNNHERALHRVEQVIKEQNMLDVLVLLEGYCHLILERANLIEHEKVCPEELQEAVSTLIYASTRCGDLPELQETRATFASRFGREFTDRAVELRNNCGVNPKVIQKLSTKMPSLENKMKMLKEIASENNVVVHIPIDNSIKIQELNNSSSGFPRQNDDGMNTPERRKYKDVADAAQAAFESAAYAAAAARAAVELSRFRPTDGDDSYTPGKTKLQNCEEEDVIIKTEAKIVFDGSDEEEGSKGVNEVDQKSEFDGEEMDNINEPLNINRRPISVRTTRTR